MATPDILITPGAGTMAFTGSVTGTMQLRVAESGALHFEGDQGSLLTITDDLSDSLFSVNDAAGMPVFEVFADDTIKSYRNNESKLEIDPDNNRIRLRDNTYISGDLIVSGDITSTSASHESTSYTASTHVSGLSGYFGKVGIGTASFGANDNMGLYVTAKGDDAIVMQRSPGSSVKWSFNLDNTDFCIKDIQQGQKRLIIQNPEGYVMIGSNSSPQAQLQVNGDASITGELRVNNHVVLPDGYTYKWGAGDTWIQGSSAADEIKLITNSSPRFAVDNNVTQVTGDLRITQYVRHGGDTDTFFGFPSNQHYVVRTNGTHRFLIDNYATQVTGDLRVAGDVGIGTSNPEGKLHVFGADAAVAPAGTADIGVFEFTAGAGIDGVSLLFPDNKGGQLVFGTPADNDAGRISYSGPTVATVANRDSMRFYTSGVEQARISAGGNVGIGTTAPDSKLMIEGGGYNSSLKIKAAASHGGIQFEDSAGNTDGYIYADSESIGFLDAGTHWMIQCKNDDFINFQTNNHTQHMRIQSNGKVLIGEGQDPTALLTVSGDASITGELRVKDGIYVSDGPSLGSAYIQLGNSNDYANFTSAQLHLAGGTNAGFQTDAKRKIFLSDYDNDDAAGGSVLFECIDENQNVDIKFIGGTANGGTPGSNYFRGSVGIGTSGQYASEKLSVNGSIFANASDGSGLIISRATVADDESGTIEFRYGTNLYYSASIEAKKLSGGHTNLYFYNGRSAVKNANPTITLDSLGKVGIGEVSPQVPLHISSDLAAGYNPALMIDNNDTTVGNEIAMLFRSRVGVTNTDFSIRGIANASDDMDLTFNSDDGTERMRITSDGKVGIGTSVAQALLAVDGDASISGDISLGGGGSSVAASLKFVNDNERSRITSNYDSGGGGRLGFWTDTAGGSLLQRVTIKNDGDVGIGTASDLNGKVTIRQEGNSAGDNHIFCQLSHSAVNHGASVFLKTSTNSTNNRYGARIRAIRNVNNNAAADLAFSLENTAASALEEMVRFTSDGNVGIGTTIPQAKLAVNGNASITGQLRVNSTSYFHADLYLKESTPRLYFQDTDTAQIASIRHMPSTTRLGFFDDSNNERLSIITEGGGSQGNVGIGTTDPANKFHINIGTNLNWIFGYPSNATTSLAALNDAESAYVVGRIDASRLELNSQAGGNVSIKTSTAHAALTVNGDASITGELRTAANVGVNAAPIGRMHVYQSGDSQPALLVEGSQGSLFSVEDSLTGSLMSVNDIAGLPVFEAFDDGTIVMGQYNSGDFIVTGNQVGIGMSPGDVGSSSVLNIQGGASKGLHIYKSDGATLNVLLEPNASENATLYLKDSGGTTRSQIAASDYSYIVGNLQVGVSAETPGSKLLVDGDVGISGELAIDEMIVHGGDPNTYLRMTPDRIRLFAGGANMLNLIETTQNELVVNDDSGDIDFRVESNEKTHMLFVEGGTDRVGIGTADPVAALHIHGNSDNGDDDCQLVISDADTTAGSKVPSILFRSLNDAGNSYISTNRIIGTKGFGMQFATETSSEGTLSTVMTLDNSQNAGIGTRSPDGRLHTLSDGTGIIVANKTITGNAFEVFGAQGNLLTVTDDLSDSLMSVNDAAGMPVFEVFADDTIKSYRNNESKFEIDPDNNQIRLRDDVYISGSLTITGGLQFALPSSELTASNDATDDKILLWDESVDTWKYMTLDNLQDSIDTAGGGGAVSAVANGSNNRVATFSSADALNGESNLTFDGTNLAVNAGTSAGSRLSVNGDVGITGTTRIKGSLGAGQVGVGGTATVPDCEFHVSDGTAGSIAANGNAQACIESSAHAALQFLSPSTHNAIIYFGDAAGNDPGYINYVHPTDTMNLYCGGGVRTIIDSTATQVTGDLRVHGDANPSRDDECDMGTTSLKWRAGHFNDIHIHGAADYGGVSIAGTRFLVFDANNYTVDYLNASEIIYQSAISVNDTSVSHSQAITFTVTINGASTSTVAVTWPAGS